MAESEIIAMEMGQMMQGQTMQNGMGTWHCWLVMGLWVVVSILLIILMVLAIIWLWKDLKRKSDRDKQLSDK